MIDVKNCILEVTEVISVFVTKILQKRNKNVTKRENRWGCTYIYTHFYSYY